MAHHEIDEPTKNRFFFSAAQFSLLVLHHIKVRPIPIYSVLVSSS